jgi:hypothetical protein
MPAPTPPTEGRERRAVTSALELRTATPGQAGVGTATGYAVLFNAVTTIGDYWQEKIAPGAFDDSLAKRDVVALHSHDLGRVVGRTGAGTLTLRADTKGVAFENALPDTSDGRDLSVSIDRGDIPGMSFGFVSTREEWDETVEPPMRTILTAELYEITYTACPAYPDTTVGMRSLEHARAERRVDPAAGTHRHLARRARQAQLERGI